MAEKTRADLDLPRRRAGVAKNHQAGQHEHSRFRFGWPVGRYCLEKFGGDANSRMLEAGMMAEPNKMGLNIDGNCISSQPVLLQSIVRRVSASTVRPAQNQTLHCQRLAGDFLKIHVRQGWVNYITDCCRNCDNLETMSGATTARERSSLTGHLCEM